MTISIWQRPWFPAGLGYLIGILSYLAGAVLNSAGLASIDANLLAIISLLIGFSIDRFVTAFASDKRDAEVDEAHRKILEQIANSFSAQNIGTSDRVMSLIVESVKDANLVRNTFINVSGSAAFDSQYETDIVSAYQHFIDARDTNRWMDIISVNELFEFRYIRVNPRNRKTTQHQIAVMRNNMPIINFIHLSFPGSRSDEVYFGWLFDKLDTHSVIYRSVDVNITSMFKNYFRILWESKSEETFHVNYANDGIRRIEKSSFVNKSGTWITVGIQEGEPVNYGAFSITFEDVNPLISGQVLEFANDDLSTEIRARRDIRHTNITNTGNKIYFEYKADRVDDVTAGFCVYNFYKSHIEGMDRDLIKGYYFEDNAKGRIIILGLKVDKFNPTRTIDVVKVLRDNRSRLHELIQEIKSSSKPLNLNSPEDSRLF